MPTSEPENRPSTPCQLPVYVWVPLSIITFPYTLYLALKVGYLLFQRFFLRRALRKCSSEVRVLGLQHRYALLKVGDKRQIENHI